MTYLYRYVQCYKVVSRHLLVLGKLHDPLVKLFFRQKVHSACKFLFHSDLQALSRTRAESSYLNFPPQSGAAATGCTAVMFKQK